MVQGVGFRPFVYRLAGRYRLSGWVRNTNRNVLITVTGETSVLQNFLRSIREEAPAASVVEEIEMHDAALQTFDGFTILASRDVSDDVTGISPDIAVCSECMDDTRSPGIRENYPFVNCTHCGPRFTIIRDLPYDRPLTTMQPFVMCPECHREYETVLDRRFHAQPVACNRCGPHYELHSGGKRVPGTPKELTAKVAELIGHGGVVLIKGLGGMHLACDAFSEQAVERLRKIKIREGKPFAVMFRNDVVLRDHVILSTEEETSLKSWRRPIVLLKMKETNESGSRLPAGINADLDRIGVMLPYMPVHYMLFDELKTDAIVLTSGNLSDEPILINNEEAVRKFSGSADALLLHNRDIHNRADDSVVKIMDGRERILRRSRGYVPSAINLDDNAGGIVAFGAELTNCFCVGKAHKAILSQHIGDLKGMETEAFYRESMERFLHLFRVKPVLHAADLHPEYLSTKIARQKADIPLVLVQHHHAHIASCMAEYRIGGKVIGVALDGTGYGDDGHTWGSEFMVCDLLDYERMFHFEYLPLPGGDRGAEEPWRMAVSWLNSLYGKGFRDLGLPFLAGIDPEKPDFILQMIERKVNSPLTCGAGRIFDAVSSLLNLCQVATFRAEGPMRLESVIQSGIEDFYPFEISETIKLDEILHGIVEDILRGTSTGVISARFHNTIAAIVAAAASSIRNSYDIHRVVLSGGVFQNGYLFERTVNILRKDNFEVYTHAAVPCNDGGIALGQLAVAAERRNKGCV